MRYNRGHFMLALFALFVTLFVGAIYAYMLRSTGRSVIESAAMHESARVAASLQSREKSFLEKYEKTEQDWARLPGFFVSSGNIVQFIEDVESLGSSVGVVVKLSSIEADNMESAKSGTAGSVRARVETTGSWSSVMRILRLAEVMPYKVEVNDIRLNMVTVGTEKDIKNVWNLTFGIKAAMLGNNAAGITSTTSAISK